MNTRASCDARGRLRRAKSASSVQRRRQIPLVPEPLDPEMAKHHALAAASRAFLRASERSSIESRGSYDYMSANEGPNNVAVPQRRRPPSIRFADDERSVSQMSVMSTSPSVPFTSSTAIDDTNSHSVPCALPPISEFQGLDGGDSSVPSSYRRLRKAKSMFSTRHRTSNFARGVTVDLDNGSPVSRKPSGDNPPYGTLRRSMSFLKGSNQISQSLRHTRSHDAAIQLARNQFLQDMEHQGQQERRSSIFAIKKREPRPLRKTFRTSSESDVDIGAVTHWPEHAKGVGFHMKGRTFSISTIKKGLKRVFGRSRSTEQKLPAQKLHASRSQFGDYISAGSATDPECHPETPTEKSCSHDRTYSSSNHYPEWTGSGRSRTPTVRMMQSSESLCTSNSRVTSWTDSTAANTIATRNAIDRNSLSIIREHGDTNQQPYFASPESHARRGYSAFSKPLKARLSAHKLDGSVDSQRVYSALMKRIDNSAVQRRDEQIFVGTVKGGRPIPERASSVYSQGSDPSIRQTLSESSMKSFFTANARPLSAQSRSPMRTHYPGNHFHAQDQYQNEKTSHRRSGQSLRESESTFFPTSPYGKPETPSPYRRAMASIDRARDDSDDDSGSVIVSKLIRSENVPNSPSVYSRTTSGNTPRPEGTTLDADSTRYRNSQGMATIFASHTTSYSSPRKSADSRPTVVPVKPSGDWQKWMSSQIARIDRHGSVLLPTGSAAREHYREETQIDGDELQPVSPTLMLQPSVSFKGNSIAESRSPLVELKVPIQSNFSRPLYRSPSALTMVPTQKTSNNGAAPCSDEEADVFGASPDSQHRACISSSKCENSTDQSLMRSRSNGSIQVAESPTPRRETSGIRQRHSLREQRRNGPMRQSVDTGDAKAVQFRSIRNRRDNGISTKENSRTGQSPSYGANVAEHHTKLQDIQSTIGSKRMVDMFLSSRRQQTSTSDSNSEPAFL